MNSAHLRRIYGSTALLLVLTGNSMAQEPTKEKVTAETVRTENIREMTTGAFAPTLDSLDGYQCPQWFRDAKFGIWSHWGPQSVARSGDWAAQRMYIEGGRTYKNHLEEYGHPSKVGYKDMAPLWKAEKWNPEKLMDLYVKAGAHYFVSIAVHHDNFDLWDSKYQPKWNSTQMGPHRDVVGEWQKAAKARGLPFGVSEHLGASYTWYKLAHGADKKGPLAGVPYDAADPQWQDLYHAPTAPGDNGWLTTEPANHRNWFLRIKDLVDKYQPELLYSDSGLPFPDDAGLPLVAHFYNANMRAHNGKLTAVYNSKEAGHGRWVQDLERGVMNGINPEPWQTDTSVGDWFYDRDDKYKKPATVVQMLVDIVSKNGNLLLNMVQRPDGSLDDEVQTILDELAVWMPVNGEAIFGTRPWVVFGEGAPSTTSGAFNEDKIIYSNQDIRFTSKGDDLYAIMLGWPEDRRAVIKALATDSPGITSGPTQVSLLGSDAKLKWTRTAKGLEIELPENAPTKYAVAFKIGGVKSVPQMDNEARRQWLKTLMPPPDQTVAPDANGVLTLDADKADLHGDVLGVEGEKGQRNLGNWRNAQEWASWAKVKIERPGTYRVSADVAGQSDSGQIALKIAGQTLNIKAVNTGGWQKYQRVELGEVKIEQAGMITVEARPVAEGWQAFNLSNVRLTPVR